MMRRAKRVEQSVTWKGAGLTGEWQVAPEPRDHGALRSLSRLHPLSWSLPLMTVRGTSVRLHAVFVAWGACELILAMGVSGVGVQSALAAVYGLLAVLVFKEMIRGVADAEEVPGSVGGSTWRGGRIAVLWPGGTFGQGGVRGGGNVSRETAARHAVVGIAASAVMVGISSAIVLASGATWDMLWFSPLHPAKAIAESGVTQGWMLWAWWLYAMSVVACGVNLIPLGRTDAGVLVESLASGKWWKEQVPLAGWLIAAVVICTAIVFDSTRLVAVVACCAWWSMKGERASAVERVARDAVAVGPALADERAVATINAWTRLRAGGVESISVREIALLDQWQAELRDRLHSDCGESVDRHGWHGDGGNQGTRSRGKGVRGHDAGPDERPG